MKIKYSKSDVKLFELAAKLRDKGEYDEAIKILKKLLNSTPHSPAFNGMLGGFYFNLDKFHSALRYFKAASKLNPKSELASLGYFHSLWELNFIKAALNEMDRYLRVKDCKDYREIITELNSKRKRKYFMEYSSLIVKIYKKYVDK